MTDRQLYILDRYHNGMLTDDERKEFDQYMELEEFSDLAEIGRDVGEVIGSIRTLEFRDKLAQWEKSAKTTKSGLSKRLLIWILLLVFTLLSILYFISIKKVNTTDQHKLFTTYLQPYKNIYKPVSRSTELLSLDEKAMFAYEQGDYEKAIELFSQITKDEMNEDILFYDAVSYLLLDNRDRSYELFSNLATSKKYGRPSEWYLFLLAVHNNDTETIDRLGAKLKNQTSHASIGKKVSDIMSQLKDERD